MAMESTDMHKGQNFIDWKYCGALLAEASDSDQVDFFKAFVKEILSWDTRYQMESQLCFVSSKLSKEEKSLLEILAYENGCE